MSFVLDACAMIAFLRDEPGANVVENLLADPSQPCVAHSINLCEVYYDFIRTVGVRRARAALNDLGKIGVKSRRDISRDFCDDVGELKGTIKRVSLADCFAIALARKLDAEIVTSDHHEFDAIAQAKWCRVRFIR